jgi:feruloyl-CoA synthase
MPETAVDLFAAPNTAAEHRDDGTVLLRSRTELGEYAPSIVHSLRANAAADPNRLLVAERRGDRWAEVSWGDARQRADAIAQALLDHGLGPERPLMILSGNSTAHLLLTLGAYTAGVPVLPVSTAYSLVTRDHERIRAIAQLCSPGMVFADDPDRFGPALDSLSAPGRIELVAGDGRNGALRLDDVMATSPGEDVERAFERLGPDTVAKLLFTSGSTGKPKAVINTQRMMCSNQAAMGRVWPFLHDDPPILLEWLPWSHTFGGNHNLNQVLTYGGSLYLDGGRPDPALFDRTLSALREVRPTIFYNVPIGYAMLVPRLEEDRELAEAFFSRLRLMFYAAAALPQTLWDRLRAIADSIADHQVPLTSSWGTTETAPALTTAHFTSARCGCVGVPLPGATVKLVPQGDRFEIRVKGPNITPGYFGDDVLTAEAFDEEGFYRPGDAVRFVDDDDPDQGLMFDGRLSEDFKLTTGTFVRVGKVRTALVSSAGVIKDAVIAGDGREQVAALAWIDEQEASRRLGVAEPVAPDDPALREHLAGVLARLNAEAGSAGRIARLLILAEPPSIDAGEITDKGYVNQRAALERRASEVDRLFEDPPGDAVILPAP